MENESGIQDDFVKDDGIVEDEPGGQQEAELDLSQPYLAMTDDDGKEVQLTGQEVLDRLGKTMDLEKQIAELTAKASQPVIQQLAQQQPIVQQQVQQQQDPALAIRAKAQDAMTRFANGDLEAIPQILDAIGQFAQMQAQQTAGTSIQQRDAEQRFLSTHSDFTEAAQTGKVKAYLAQHPEYGPIEGFLAMKLESQKADYEQKIAALNTQLSQATTTGKKAGEKEAVQIAKGRGGLRFLVPGGAGSARQPVGGGNQAGKFTSFEDASETMKAGLAKIRGVSSLD
jgi:hypothetical protein